MLPASEASQKRSALLDGHSVRGDCVRA